MSISGLNAGDILLINNRSKNRWLNLTGQKLIRRSSSVNSTHVALSLGDGVFIHANTTCGVDLVYFPDLLKESEDGWKVIRHIELTDEVEEKIKKAAIFHLGKAYNYKFILRENDKSLFCSQFVDLVFKSIGISIFSREENNNLWHLNNALPVDFDRLISDNKTWSDVTRTYLDKCHDGFFELFEINFTLLQTHVSMERGLWSDYFALQSLMHYVHDSYNKLPDEVKDTEHQKILTNMIDEFNPCENKFFYNFWNAKPKK